VLVSGGVDSTGALVGSYIYDPLIDFWSSAASVSPARGYPTLALLGNGKVLTTLRAQARSDVNCATIEEIT
jgi:hypothetical protein